MKILSESTEIGKDVEVLVAGGGRESLRTQRRPAEALERGLAFQFFAEERLDQWAEVNFLA